MHKSAHIITKMDKFVERWKKIEERDESEECISLVFVDRHCIAG